MLPWTKDKSQNVQTVQGLWGSCKSPESTMVWMWNVPIGLCIWARGDVVLEGCRTFRMLNEASLRVGLRFLWPCSTSFLVSHSLRKIWEEQVPHSCHPWITCHHVFFLLHDVLHAFKLSQKASFSLKLLLVNQKSPLIQESTVYLSAVSSSDFVYGLSFE